MTAIPHHARRITSKLAGASAMLLLFGCVSPGGIPVLHYGVEDAPEGKRIVWPTAPEVPRYLYAGQLIGEINFRREGNEARTAGARIFRWVVGLDSPEAEMNVLQRPLAGVTDAEGRVFVTDMSRRAVYVFDEPAGKLHVWERAQGLANFAAPAGVTLGPERQIWVADADLGLVIRLAEDGEPAGSFGRGLLKRPTGLVRDPAQKLTYVADTYAHDVKVFDDEGRLVHVIGRRGERPGEFNYPTHVAFSRGELYVTDTMNNRVQVFSGEGEVRQRQFGRTGLYVGNFVRPKGVAVDNEGHVYVIESYYDHLLVFTSRGQFLLPIGGTGHATGRFYLPAGVWTDSRNRIFVADMFNGRVVVFQFLGGN